MKDKIHLNYLYLIGDSIGVHRSAQDVIGLVLVILTTIACLVLTGIISPGYCILLTFLSFYWIGSDSSFALIENKRLGNYVYSDDVIKLILKYVGIVGLIIFLIRRVCK